MDYLSLSSSTNNDALRDDGDRGRSARIGTRCLKLKVTMKMKGMWLRDPNRIVPI
ncbi:hypothetical protein YC2023_119583 [Brassica napus]